MRKFLKFLGTVVVVLAICLVGFVAWVSDKYVVPILTYHSVDYESNTFSPTMHPDHFQEQMDYLSEHGYNVIPMSELIEGIEEGKSFPHKTVVLTFDDGLEDHYTIVANVLKVYDFPATMFVPSQHVGEEGFMTWDQLRDLVDQGFEVGSHTRVHTYLPDKPLERQYDEIAGSKKLIEDQLGTTVEILSYPIGGFSDQTIDILKETGYKAACSTNRGRSRFNKRLFELNRVRFGNKSYSDLDMMVKLSGYYNLFRKPKKPY